MLNLFTDSFKYNYDIYGANSLYPAPSLIPFFLYTTKLFLVDEFT